ncbi:oxidoreductase [Spirochaetia bacterium]|nr:oxidoreductase [Spirochaetia bacterium]
MKTIKLGLSGLTVPALAVGCMRMNSLSKSEAAGFVKNALDIGANFFDHADIYGGGTCESIFAEAIGMNPAVREKIIIQSKCSIRPGVAFDFSREHIITSTEGILKRLNTEYLDVLLLHRPDTLMEGEEVAAAFDQLHHSGKVRHFGVSNQNPAQIRLLKKYVRQPIVADQLQLSPTNAAMITAGFHVNMQDDGAVDRDGGVLEYCRLEDITIQPWSPFQHHTFAGTYLGNPDFLKLNETLDELAVKYGDQLGRQVTNTSMVMAWLGRHPAHFQPVTGTMNIQRLKECALGLDITLTRDEWYAIYLSAGNFLP